MPLLLIDEPTVYFGSELLSRLDGFRAIHANQSETSISTFPSITTFNVFVGANNSGKSRLLRHLFSERVMQLAGVEDDRKFHVLCTHAKEAEQLTQSFKDSNVHAAVHFVGLLQDIVQFLRTPGKAIDFESGRGRLSGLVRSNDLELWINRDSQLLDQAPPPGMPEELWNFRNKLFDDLRLTPADFSEVAKNVAVKTTLLRYSELASNGQRTSFCPPLRGHWRIADTLDAKLTDPDRPERGLLIHAEGDPLAATYCETFAWAPGNASWTFDASRLLITGGRLFELAQRMQTTSDRVLRKRFSDSVATILDELVGLKEAKLIATDLRTHNSEGNLAKLQHLRIESTFGDTSLHDLGDGVSMCLIVLLPLFMCVDGTMFIEEPELHLHPGQQRALVRLIVKQARTARHKVFLTSHSPIVLDELQILAANDFKVFRFRKESDNPRRHTVTEVDSVSIQELEELGAGASALLATCLIAVEGPSDVIYLRALLELAYKSGEPKFCEGRDFAFVTTGGSNLDDALIGESAEAAPVRLPTMSHYILIVADHDIGKEELHKNRCVYIAQHRPRYRYLTTVAATEVENLLSWDAWRQLLPIIKPIRWRQPREEVAETIVTSIRIESLADWACSAPSESPPSAAASKSFAKGKTKAARAFAKLVSEEKVSWSSIGIRAQKMALAVGQFLSESTRLAGSLPGDSTNSRAREAREPIAVTIGK